ncbi:Helix-turn-helix domain-containing protein [Mucilaginibacter sp. OK268]|uniref:helix-turn-helix domain-containing protein n=1 Tax=Mucilaginibacter sp. OK268 TaxID=1881048 RepID=UPI000881440E|nr:helix-turn-helix domain-containing protein [Mucilaginibacter sp. OK268]SDP43945.1 Helix-turn-helix domain-containing protein [Mucilaginibacter sp. OK268]
MAIEIITKDDLELFRAKLLEDIKNLLNTKSEAPKKWLKSYQVKNMLKISPGTLQTLRTKGTIRYSKIGGIFYYKYEDILKILNNER